MERQARVLVVAGVLVCVSCMDGISGLGGGGGGGGSGFPGGRYDFTCTPPDSVSIAPGEDSVEAGRAITLTGQAPGASFCVALWSSSDSTVAVPGLNGSPFSIGPQAVIGVSPGAATIAATVAGATATALIRVLPVRTPFTSVSTGSSSCVVAADGRVYCWGGASLPTRGPGTISLRAVSTGNSRTCGITPEGSAYCWGYVWGGPPPLFTGGVYHPELVLVSGGIRFSSVDAGKQDHACGITSDGAAVCWGDNTVSQLGIGFQGGDLQAEPQPVAGGFRFASVVAGGFHSCALTGAGAAYCWGMAYHGQLGNGQMGSGGGYPSAPMPVSGGLTFRQVSAGQWHTCGVTTAGAAYCWGLNDEGQLGSGDTVGVSVPHPVASSLSFTSVGAGYRHTCGLTTSGDVYCWGADFVGTGSVALLPKRVDATVRFTSLSVGANSACGLAADGRVYCLGHDGLGDGSGRSSEVPVRVSGQP